MPANSRKQGPLTYAFAVAVKVMRIARGMSPDAFAGQADINPSTLEKIEAGQATVDLEQLGRIAAVLGKMPSDVLAVAEVPEGQPLDAATKTELARRAIELAGKPPETIHHPLIDRLLKKNPPNHSA